MNIQRDEENKKYRFSLDKIELDKLQKGEVLKNDLGEMVIRIGGNSNYLYILGEIKKIYVFTNWTLFDLGLKEKEIYGKVYKSPIDRYSIKLVD